MGASNRKKHFDRSEKERKGTKQTRRMEKDSNAFCSNLRKNEELVLFVRQYYTPLECSIHRNA